MATTNKEALKNYFKAGLIPTESNFADLIDSIFVQEGSGFDKTANTPLKLNGSGTTKQELLQLYNDFTVEGANPELEFTLVNGGVKLNKAEKNILFLATQSGKVGIGMGTEPVEMLEVNGSIKIASKGRVEVNRGKLAFSHVMDDWNHVIYNNQQNIDQEGAWDGMKMNVFEGLNIRVGAATLGTAPSSALFIDKTGKIGIGVVPSAGSGKLEINGKIKITGGQPGAGKVLTSDANGLASWEMPAASGSISKLTMGNAIENRKIILWQATDNDHQFYGMGINNNTLRYQVDIPGSNHIFYAGTSPTTSNELMRIQGNGNVGIRASDPKGVLHVETGGAGDWTRLVVKTTSFWGDGTNTVSETAGTQYVTIGAQASGIMLANPHVVWNPGNNAAAIRYGRSGGVATGDWWEAGVNPAAGFHIRKTASPNSGLEILANGTTRTNALQVSANGSVFNRMQGGTASLGNGASGGASQVKVFTVTFPNPFSSVPKVICTARTQDGAAHPDTFGITTKQISTTQFVINVVRLDATGAWGQILQLDWFAFE